MQKELYFDISSESSGGSLYRIKDANGSASFLYEHSTYDEYTGDVNVYKTPYTSFDQFFNKLRNNAHWFYQHPLFVHPEVREVVAKALAGVDWTVQGDFKWQTSHKRQWEKVLSDPTTYYEGPRI